MIFTNSVLEIGVTRNIRSCNGITIIFYLLVTTHNK